MALFFFSLFIYHVLCIINYGEQRPRAALAMAKQKPHVPWVYPPRHHGKSHLPKSLWYCNMDTCSGSCMQSEAMDFICLSCVYVALLDLISCPELFSNSGSQYSV